MAYTVHQLAELAGISVRTLHYYDETGLLAPAGIKKNGYRYYGEAELLRLQQILFFKELEFSLDEIRRILKSSGFDMTAALQDQKKLIQLKKARLDQLIKTIDKTIKKINHEKNMSDKDLYDGFSSEEAEQYAAEAKQRWGQTKAYKQSQIRVNALGKEGMARIQAESEALMQEIVANMDKGPESELVQALIDRHYNALRNFYEPSMEIYTGLAEMYVSDPRFAAFYEKLASGLAQFMQDAMKHYVALNSKK